MLGPGVEFEERETFGRALMPAEIDGREGEGGGDDRGELTATGT